MMATAVKQWILRKGIPDTNHVFDKFRAEANLPQFVPVRGVSYILLYFRPDAWARSWAILPVKTTKTRRHQVNRGVRKDCLATLQQPVFVSERLGTTVALGIFALEMSGATVAALIFGVDKPGAKVAALLFVLKFS